MGLVTALATTLVLAQAPAPAAPPPWSVEVMPDGIRLTVDVFGAKTEVSSLKLGPVNDALRRGNLIYVARGAGGIQIVDAENPRAPVPLGGFGEDSVVLHLAISGDQLVALSKSQSFVLYDLTTPLHPRLATNSLSSEEPPPARGTVRAAQDGVVVINGGTNQGFAQARNIAIYSRTRMSEKDKVAREAGMQMPGMLVAVVRLDRVEADRSLGSYGRGDDPKSGDLVIATNEATTANLSGPRTIPFNWQFDLDIRPFLGVGAQGYPFGMLIDLSAAYYFEDVPLRVQVGLVPIGFVAGGNAPYNPITFDATLAFYSQFFEIGFGGGFSTVSVAFPAALEPQTVETQGTIDQSVRLGAIDGVNFIWFSAIGYGTSSFDLASARGQLNIPVTTRLTMGFEAGGGRGFAYGDFVLRTYVGGLGGPGTFILSGGLGGAAAIDNSSTDANRGTTTSVGGPCLVLGLEARL